MVICPSTITGCDRWYSKNYRHAMAIVCKRGKPALFITKTMDVNCKEIAKLLKPGQLPYDRPDLLCRVFERKCAKLICMIVKEHIFGKCVAYVASIEFQNEVPHIDTCSSGLTISK